MLKLIRILLFTCLLSTGLILGQGNVYLIIGSDTAIWDVMDVAKYNCSYSYKVIPDKTRNFYKVMQLSYRDQFSDSYGNKLKLTWWLMGGNIFRYATNKNVPYPNVMVPYISKKYYGTLFTQYKDELSLHYHTFAWTDYDKDGKFYWNQAEEFSECKNDFEYTLAQFLLEENIFPVSFRSGWNHMSNQWQSELDKYLPYSMHNEAPAYHVDSVEPTDNIYDWRLASKEFIPYRPSSENYQLNGNGKGWNLHSKYAGGITQVAMNDIFAKARTKDQVVCLWGHVWDDLFPEYVFKLDTFAKAAAITYPDVKFKYCTAVEGMQLWRKNNDTTPPVASLQEIASGNKIKFKVQTDESIFQTEPFVALKDINEFYKVVEFNKTGINEWTSIDYYEKSDLAKVGLAVTDSLGNLTTQIINYLQNDIYIDNEDTGYNEVNGTWVTESNASWGLDSRKSILQANDSSKVKWNFVVNSSHNYNIFYQIPKVITTCKNVLFRIYADNQLVNTIKFDDALVQMDWVYLTTQYFNSSVNNYIEMVATGNGQGSNILLADVIKISPLVRQKWLATPTKIIDLGFVVKKDTVTTNLNLENHGIENLTITSITSKNNLVFTRTNFPLTIPKMGRISLPLYFCSNDLGQKVDTLFIQSDDPFNRVIAISLSAEVTNYFRIVDNEEILNYSEFGIWSNSVAQAFGSSSRFATLNQSPRANARFSLSVADNGFYDVLFIVPKTVNASNNALYVVVQGNKLLDSIYVDQNLNSGNWVFIKNCYFTNDLPVLVRIIDTGNSTVGAVLRTDAIKLSFTGATSHLEDFSKIPTEFELLQNYPNPFNPSTTIVYHLAKAGLVKLKIFNLLGEEIAVLTNEEQSAGSHYVKWTSKEVSSGIYFYRLECGDFVQMKKMILIK